MVLPSNGTGSFGAPAYYEAEQWTYAAAAFDADGDGDVDVATVAGFSAALTVHANPGSGSFRVLTRYPLAQLTDAVESADIDNDGDVDIVTNNEVNIASNDAVIVVLKNNGDGTFVPGGSYTYPPPRNFGDIKLRDLNGDGFVDMLLAPDDDYPPYNFGTALNNGDGTFATDRRPAGGLLRRGLDRRLRPGRRRRSRRGPDRGAGVPQRAAAAHLRVPQRREQAFALAVTLASSAGFARGMAGADMNGDGRLDLVTALATGMGVFPNNGGFSFGPPVISSTSPYKFKLADFNNDGKLDVGMVLSQTEVYEVEVATALGLGGGIFAPAQTQRGSNTAESLRISDDLDVADFDGDGHVDLLTLQLRLERRLGLPERGQRRAASAAALRHRKHAEPGHRRRLQRRRPAGRRGRHRPAAVAGWTTPSSSCAAWPARPCRWPSTPPATASSSPTRRSSWRPPGATRAPRPWP